MKIAVSTPSKTEKSETFIQNHISNLSIEKVIIYGGSFQYLLHNYQLTIHQKRRFKFVQFIKNKLEEQVKLYKPGDLSLITCKWGGFEESSNLTNIIPIDILKIIQEKIFIYVYLNEG